MTETARTPHLAGMRTGAPAEPIPDLRADVLRAGYLSGGRRVSDLVTELLDRITSRGQDNVWITLVSRRDALHRAAELDELLTAARCDSAARSLPPLFGLPFAVKDNIDVAGLPTTAGCAEFAYQPAESAPLVDRLLAAGAICLGKTNLDQFATGLSGTRSPYGVPASPFDPTMIAGGSSSGSAVAVSVGLVTFAIGTDTAGSGRVPAALTNTVGLKPSRGLVSTRGIVPACRSLDCPSVFALSVPDAYLVLSVLNGHDDADPYSRRLPVIAPATISPPDLGGPGGSGPADERPAGLRVGVPRPADLDFLGDDRAAAVFDAGLDLLAAGGATLTPIDLAPFLEAGSLLYQGPWLAERYADLADFLTTHPDTVHPVTRAVVTPGAQVTGAEVFRGQTRLRELRRRTEATWRSVDVIALPTVPTTYRIDAMRADPIALNANLGRYTTFVNLLDLTAVAVPVGFAGGLPFGLTLMAPAGSDALLCAPAAELHRRSGLPIGAGTAPAGEIPMPAGETSASTGGAAKRVDDLVRGRDPIQPEPGPERERPPEPTPEGFLDLAIFGAHMSGLPLNGELTGLGGRFVRPGRTRPRYRLYALAGTGPPRPGVVRVAEFGASIEAEVWRLPTAALGELLPRIPAPLSIGTVDLEGGQILGFLCEAVGVADGRDITHLGGWRRYLERLD